MRSSMAREIMPRVSGVSGAWIDSVGLLLRLERAHALDADAELGRR